MSDKYDDNGNGGAEIVDITSITGGERSRVPVNATSHTGGISSHMSADLARSAVIYMQQEDPKRRHREKIACAVNLGDFELRYPATSEEEKLADDGRTVRRKMWDEAVHALLRITSQTGLNPKFVRNDKNSCRLTVMQDQMNVSSPEQLPDEFFTMELFYCSEFELERRKLEYVKKIDNYAFTISNLKRALFDWKTPKAKKLEAQAKIESLEREKQFYIATTPDPREMDGGLIFKIELLTLKEYGVTKEKLKSILSRYMEELSKVARANGTSLPASLQKTG